MITIHNVVIDELIELLVNLREQPGVTKVDLVCDEKQSRIQIHPIVNKTKPIVPEDKLDFNNLLS